MISKLRVEADGRADGLEMIERRECTCGVEGVRSVIVPSAVFERDLERERRDQEDGEGNRKNKYLKRRCHSDARRVRGLARQVLQVGRVESCTICDRRLTRGSDSSSNTGKSTSTAAPRLFLQLQPQVCLFTFISLKSTERSSVNYVHSEGVVGQERCNGSRRARGWWWERSRLVRKVSRKSNCSDILDSQI